jgi:hypothetical protein
MTWSTVANLLRDRKASFDHDKLYALYGLLPASILAQQRMTVSYTPTVEQVFTEVTYNIMEVSQSLMMFNFLDSKTSERAHDLPSWVPDWRLPPANRHEGNLRVVREQMYNASQGSEFYLRRLDSNTICLKGSCIGVVAGYDRSGVVPTASVVLDTIYKIWGTECHKMASHVRSPTQTFWRTMLWDCAPGDIEGTLKPLDPEELTKMIAAHDRAVRVGYGDEPYGEGQSAENARRTSYMMNCAKNRVIFFTEHFYVGMAPDNLQLGDHIFIVSGNSHPVILRPSKKYADTWNAVGECYLHEFMHGFGLDRLAFFSDTKALEYRREVLRVLPDVEPAGVEKNPRWDEITEQRDGSWQWLLIE